MFWAYALSSLNRNYIYVGLTNDWIEDFINMKTDLKQFAIYLPETIKVTGWRR
jgi:ribonucleotide reductase beta subunit family protein with ferritin-like domain